MERPIPFARAKLLALALSAFADGVRSPRVLNLINTPYVSRGHGRAAYSGKKRGPSPSGKYARTFNGKREVARRLRQIAAGQLQVSA